MKVLKDLPVLQTYLLNASQFMKIIIIYNTNINIYL